MTDPDKPDFQVVDRRRSAQSTESTAAESTASEPLSSGSGVDVPADTSSTNAGLNPAANQDAETAQTAFTDSSSPSETPSAFSEAEAGSESGEDAMPMPDPGALLAYVAMQMNVKTLAIALLGIFSGQAWRAMGLVANPVTGQTEKNLPDAQVAIDCVQFLLGKLDTDLNDEDRREMQRRLNDLRVNYLAKMREN